MARFDEARFALEAATNGKNTIILDDTGMPSVMVRVPAFRWCDVIEGGSEDLCSAFIVDGKKYSSIYISKYLNIIENDRAYSLPGKDPAANVTIDEARNACAKKGKGWHLMSNAEWCAVSHWADMNGTSPYGNLHAGNNAFAHHEAGVKSYGEPPLSSSRMSSTDAVEEGDYPGNAPVGRTLSGLSPASWSHDGTDSGIFDLVGNIWDWVSGLRVKDGEIQIIPDNNSALNLDESEESPYWMAIMPNGILVPPGTTGTLKYDGIQPGRDEETICITPGGVRLNTEVEFSQYTGNKPDPEFGFGISRFDKLCAANGIEIPSILKNLGLYPAGKKYRGAMVFMRSYGERVPARGGSWYDSVTGETWSLYLRDNRQYFYPDIGFRASYIPL